MPLDEVFYFIALASCLGYVVAAVQYSLRLGADGAKFLPALLFSAVWSLYGNRHISFDLILVSVWACSFLWMLKDREVMQHRTRTWILLCAIPVLGFISATVMFLFDAKTLIYSLLICTVGLLTIQEQAIRATHGSLRAMTIAVGTLFLFQLYFYAQLAATNAIAPELIQARIPINAALVITLIVTPWFITNDNKPRRRVSLSRPMAFTTTSLLITGGIMAAMGIASYLVNSQLGSYSEILQPFLLFICMLLIGFSFGSSTQRARIKVWINKNFFQTKFDYNSEWRRLSDRLAQSDDVGYGQVALNALLPIYNASSGALYIRNNDQFIPQTTLSLGVDASPFPVDNGSAFLQKAAEDWVFVVGADNPDISKSQHLIPEPIKQLGDCLAVLPLSRKGDVFGIIVILPDPQQILDFDWEDIDLLGMAGKQISSFVAYQMLAQDNAVKQQFEAYHQFTTFIMHDIKNLIAQQALVVENANRFIDNPEFVADAITTIENSVSRMNRLIMKINRHNAIDLETGSMSRISLNALLEGVIQKVNNQPPYPMLSPSETEYFVTADAENLSTAFTHIICNAQEACSADDSITISLTPGQDKNTVLCKIEDTGEGMDKAFIEQRLFKPFNSTKKTIGMGIGAYQSKQILSTIGAHISVDSTLGVGTCFTITLPLA